AVLGTRPAGSAGVHPAGGPAAVRGHGSALAAVTIPGGVGGPGTDGFSLEPDGALGPRVGVGCPGLGRAGLGRGPGGAGRGRMAGTDRAGLGGGRARGGGEPPDDLADLDLALGPPRRRPGHRRGLRLDRAGAWGPAGARTAPDPGVP